MSGTRKQGPKRVLQFLCLNDENVVPMEDRGITKSGKPTSARAAIINMLRKREAVGDMKLPVFMLAEKPDTLHDDDPLDRDFLQDKSTGKFLEPSAAWKKLRGERIAARNAKSARVKAALANADAQQVLKNVSSLVRNTSVDAAKPEVKP